MAFLAKKVPKIFPSKRGSGNNNNNNNNDGGEAKGQSKGLFRRISAESKHISNEEAEAIEAAAASFDPDGTNKTSNTHKSSKSRGSVTTTTTNNINNTNGAAKKKKSITKSAIRVFKKRSSKNPKEDPVPKEDPEPQETKKEEDEETPTSSTEPEGEADREAEPEAETPAERDALPEEVEDKGKGQRPETKRDVPAGIGKTKSDSDSHGDSTLLTAGTPLRFTTPKDKSSNPPLSVPDLPELTVPSTETKPKPNEGDRRTDRRAKLLASASTRRLIPRPRMFDKTRNNGNGETDDPEENENENDTCRESRSTPPVASVEFPSMVEPFALAPSLPEIGGRIFVDRPPPRVGDWDDATLESQPNDDDEETAGNTAADEDATVDTSDRESADFKRMKPLIERAARLALLQDSDHTRGKPGVRASFSGERLRSHNEHGTKHQQTIRRHSEFALPVPEAFLRGAARTPEQRLRQRYHRYNSCYQHHTMNRPVDWMRGSKRALLASLDEPQSQSQMHMQQQMHMHMQPQMHMQLPPQMHMQMQMHPHQQQPQPHQPEVPSLLNRSVSAPAPVRRQSHQPPQKHPHQHPNQQRIVKWHVVRTSQPAGQPAGPA